MKFNFAVPSNLATKFPYHADRQNKRGPFQGMSYNAKFGWFVKILKDHTYHYENKFFGDVNYHIRYY